MIPSSTSPGNLPPEIAEHLESLPPLDGGLVHRWLRTIHGTRAGWLELFALDAASGEPLSQFFRWPAGRSDAVQFAMEHAGTSDVWFGALLKRTARRGTEISGRYAWCDNDLDKMEAGANEEIEALAAAVVHSGTPGNRQVWVRLAGDATPSTLRQANKALIKLLGGDPKHSPDSLMRIPGTLNHKNCAGGVHRDDHGMRCRPVTWERPATRRHDAAALAARAPTDGPGEVTEGLELPDLGTLPDPLPSKLRKALQAREDDPSEHTRMVAATAVEMGLDDGQVRAALEHDLVTTRRRADPKHRQPGWWPAEFWRLVTLARRAQAAKTDAEMIKEGTTAQALMTLAQERYTFGVADDGEPYALPKDGPQVVRMLRGDKYSLRAELSFIYHSIMGKPPGNSALADSMTALEGQAQQAEPVELPLRVSRHDRELVLDLGDQTGRAVVIGPGYWKVVDRSPVLFRRTRLTGALPTPERGYRLTDTMMPLLNVPREDWPLMAACLVSMLWPDIPHPIPHLTGTEGVAKTSTTRVLRNLVDPSAVSTRGKPDEKEWDVALSAQWIVALDNLSTIPGWLSDALCRAVTGEGAIKRKLYTDADMSLISVRRVMIINGISTEITNADLAGRVITFELEPITTYQDEVSLARRWREAHPRALGALLDQAAAVMLESEQTELDPVFRMSDFARIVATMDRVNNTHALDAYRRRLETAALDVLHSDPVGIALLRFGQALQQPWEGSLADLDRLLRESVGGKPGGWPKGPVAWAVKLKRMGNPLQRAGILVQRGRRTKSGYLYVITRSS